MESDRFTNETNGWVATSFQHPPPRHLGGTAPPSGRCGVRSRSRPSDQALRVLAASGLRGFAD